MAKSLKIKTLALTGKNGNLPKMGDITISIPDTNIQYIQESLLSVEHILCEIVEEDIFNNLPQKRGKL